MFLLTIFLLFHPLHLSLINIEYNVDTQCFDVLYKINTADLETYIFAADSVNLKLGTTEEYYKSNDCIGNFINCRSLLIFNSDTIKTSNFTLISKDVIELDTWLRYQVVYNKPITKVEIQNSIFTDIFFDQQNILYFTYQNKTQHFLMSKQQEKVFLSF